ncbi:MAG: (Fe-S)-binding protein [Lewinellaceae bacterium]|nr:(Fe-S)-binding protein [Lewinellaceae bacterium]
MSQIIFLLITIGVAFLALKQYRRVLSNIRLGKKYEAKIEPSVGWKNVFLIAFGQKKMFKRWIPAVLHLGIYTAFLLTQIELIEILIDGIFGTHRAMHHVLGGMYSGIIGTIEFLSLFALVATIAFLVRRNIIKVDRLAKPELNGWPKLDANLILLGEMLLVTGIFMMNGADRVLQNIDPEHFAKITSMPISSWFGPMMFGDMGHDALVSIERFGWWLHVLVVYAFILYLPYSKHLHIFFAFPNVYFHDPSPRGKIENMPEIMNEVKSMLGMEVAVSENTEIADFGAKDITDLTWKNILDSYTCTECGRCTAVCPANITGKKLSPRKVMMSIRDRAEEIGTNLRSNDIKFAQGQNGEETTALTIDNYSDGKSLFDYISKEEIHACTTCNACVEACPVMINPLEPILQLRRYEILSESAGPPDWVPMFTSLENSGCVWQIPEERTAWTHQ